MPKEILLGLTTTPGSDWRRKCEEIDELGLKRIALFPTFLDIEERRELYGLLGKTGLEEVPHVHLRSDDTEAWEMELYETKFKTQVYNIHPQAIKVPTLAPYMRKIYVENLNKRLNDSIVKECAGLCLDFSHAEDFRIRLATAGEPLYGLLGKFPIGCCHVSPVRKIPIFGKVSVHHMKNLHELDYMAKYREHLPNWISLEMENSFTEQLQAKAYLEGVLKIV